MFCYPRFNIYFFKFLLKRKLKMRVKIFGKEYQLLLVKKQEQTDPNVN
jgi:hypothetical protein